MIGVARPLSFLIIFTPVPSHLQKSATIVTNITGFACDPLRTISANWLVYHGHSIANLHCASSLPESEQAWRDKVSKVKAQLPLTKLALMTGPP